jgi:MFS family permease
MDNLSSIQEEDVALTRSFEKMEIEDGVTHQAMFFMKLKPIGLTRINVMVMFLVQFAMYLIDGLRMTVDAYTLRDQYKVKNLASVNGDMTAYCEGLGMILDLAVGFIFDMFGRRVPMSMAYSVAAIGLLMMPMFDKVYPWFLISRLCISFSTITVNCPMIADYIDEQSQGIANGYFLMIVALANIISTTILLELSEVIRTVYIYFAAFLFIMFVSCLIIIHMKDVI